MWPVTAALTLQDCICTSRVQACWRQRAGLHAAVGPVPTAVALPGRQGQLALLASPEALSPANGADSTAPGPRVRFVSEQGVAQVLGMHPDLVGAPSLEAPLHQGGAAASQGPQHFVVADGCAPPAWTATGACLNRSLPCRGVVGASGCPHGTCQVVQIANGHSQEAA